MDQVRRLDLPVVLEMFHPARTDTCYVALLQIQGGEALVATGSGPPLRVPLAEVDRLWTRQAVFLWRDFDALSAAGDPGRTDGLGARQPVPPGLPARRRPASAASRASSGRRPRRGRAHRRAHAHDALQPRAVFATAPRGDLVSLVLEALKKLDREKGRDERGFVVMAAAPWPTRAARQWPAWAAVAAAGRSPALLACARSGRRAPAVPIRSSRRRDGTGRAGPPPSVTSEGLAAERMAAPRAPPRAGADATVAPTRARRASAPAPAGAAAAVSASPRSRACASRPSASATASRSRSINDHLVRVGDEVDGMRVLAIRADRGRHRDRGPPHDPAF